jgi:NADH:ubiquinone oxidoreductase subunit 3 (subunit A)
MPALLAMLILCFDMHCVFLFAWWERVCGMPLSAMTLVEDMDSVHVGFWRSLAKFVFPYK